ncbi:hypothetical protein ACFRJ1_09320 [Streptomyces sp. NPDC056773]|uniref:hypothetical protein n=1 Tax=unclassified Streptomyces TaxID=2593676 RepID=UPI0036B664B0
MKATPVRGLASGLLVTAIGLRLLHSALRGRALAHDHGHGQSDEAPAGVPSSRRSQDGAEADGTTTPSPSALVVLLGAVALGRTAFGILLVIGYGLGMATTLTVAGLLLVRLRDRIAARTAERAAARLRKLGRIGPAATSALVLLVGLGLAARAVTAL